MKKTITSIKKDVKRTLELAENELYSLDYLAKNREGMEDEIELYNKQFEKARPIINDLPKILQVIAETVEAIEDGKFENGEDERLINTMRNILKKHKI